MTRQSCENLAGQLHALKPGRVARWVRQRCQRGARFHRMKSPAPTPAQDAEQYRDRKRLLLSNSNQAEIAKASRTARPSRNPPASRLVQGVSIARDRLSGRPGVDLPAQGRPMESPRFVLKIRTRAARVEIRSGQIRLQSRIAAGQSSF